MFVLRKDMMFQPEPKLNTYIKPVFWLVLILAVIVITFVITTGQDEFVVRDTSAYQAVFLDNEQVYFGKLESLNDDFVSLTDVYYLRAGQVPQGGQFTPEGAEGSPSGIDLIKLGAELHAPRDEMIIGKDHIVFYEDIGSQSQIMELIRQHKSQ